MDYGSALKRRGSNPSRRSRHHSRQSPFEGSKRQLRARTLRAVLDEPGSPVNQILDAVGRSLEEVESVLGELVDEGFLEVLEDGYRPVR
jgi:A/G-specific adenine glycosylase